MLFDLIPPPVYSFLYFIQKSKLDKKILDYDAGGRCPPLEIFARYSFESHGIDINNKHVQLAMDYASKENLNLKITKDNVRKLTYADESFSFIHTWNTIFHLPRKEIIGTLKEMFRVLRTDVG